MKNVPTSYQDELEEQWEALPADQKTLFIIKLLHQMNNDEREKEIQSFLLSHHHDFQQAAIKMQKSNQGLPIAPAEFVYKKAGLTGKMLVYTWNGLDGQGTRHPNHIIKEHEESFREFLKEHYLNILQLNEVQRDEVKRVSQILEFPIEDMLGESIQGLLKSGDVILLKEMFRRMEKERKWKVTLFKPEWGEEFLLAITQWHSHPDLDRHNLLVDKQHIFLNMLLNVPKNEDTTSKASQLMCAIIHHLAHDSTYLGSKLQWIEGLMHWGLQPHPLALPSHETQKVMEAMQAKLGKSISMNQAPLLEAWRLANTGTMDPVSEKSKNTKKL